LTVKVFCASSIIMANNKGEDAGKEPQRRWLEQVVTLSDKKAHLEPQGPRKTVVFHMFSTG
jgi:hypothetical protein